MGKIRKVVLTKAVKISSEEALKDITPIDWSEDVLSGKYRNKSIIKSSGFTNKEDVEDGDKNE
jgi:hypothetical protein